MKFLIRKAASRYRNWMYGWENGLANRSTDRIVRPFEFGLEWSESWPCSKDFPRNGTDPIEYIEQLNHRVIAASDEFFGYDSPSDFKLAQASGWRMVEVHFAGRDALCRKTTRCIAFGIRRAAAAGKPSLCCRIGIRNCRSTTLCARACSGSAFRFCA